MPEHTRSPLRHPNRSSTLHDMSDSTIVVAGATGNLGARIAGELLKRGARVTEVPTHESRRVAGESHIRLGRVWWRFVWSCAKNIVWSP